MSHRVGSLISFWVLLSTGKVLSRTSVQRVTNLELQIDENKSRMTCFIMSLTERIGGNDLIVQDELGNDVLAIDNWDDSAYDKEFVEKFGRP